MATESAEEDGLYTSDSSDDPKEDSPADVISSHCLELDYEEFPSHDSSTILLSSIGISRLVEEEKEEGEEGELFSDEEGEIKDDTTSSVLLSTVSNNERSHSCSPVPSNASGPSQIRKSPTPQTGGSICRHFLQGRCSWGDECRFSHTLPPDYSPPPPPAQKRSVSPHSPAPANRVYHRPPVRPPHVLDGMPIAMFPLRFPPPIPPSFEGQPYPYPPPFNVHQLAPPPTISRPAGWGGAMVEKEESDGWLRLRTITGADDYTPEENTRHKLPTKHQGSEDSDDEQHKKRSHDTPEQWIDPWSRGKRRHNMEGDEEEEEVEKEKKKHKDKKKKTKKHKKKKRRSSGSDGDGEMSPIEKTKQRRSSDEVVAGEQVMWTEDMQYKKLSRKHK